MVPERRYSQRILTGPEHTIRFLARGHVFQNIRITNVSVGGCFATLGGRDRNLFPEQGLLEQFAFEHPDLAGSPFTARVAYTLDSPALDFMGVGITFLGPPEPILRRLEAFLGDF